jgi:predicted secreted Zn-dependent protease
MSVLWGVCFVIVLSPWQLLVIDSRSCWRDKEIPYGSESPRTADKLAMSLRYLFGLGILLLVTGCATNAASAPIASVAPQRVDFGSATYETPGKPHVVLRQDIQKEIYTVGGRGLQDIRDDLDHKRPYSAADARRFDANAMWSLTWNFHFDSRPGACTLSDANVVLRVLVQMPELTTDPDRTDKVMDDWTRFSAMLETHEAGHVAHYIDGATALAEAFRTAGTYETCDGLRSALADLGAAEIEAIRVADLQYDTSTQHGRLQGANFP